MTASALRTLIALARAIEQAHGLDDTFAATVALKHHVRYYWPDIFGPITAGEPIGRNRPAGTTTYDGDIDIGIVIEPGDGSREIVIRNPLGLIEAMEEDFTSVAEELAEAAGVELPREADDDGCPPPHITGNSMTGRRG